MGNFIHDLLKENVFDRYKWSIGRVSFMLVLLTILSISIITAIKSFTGETFNYSGIDIVLTSLVWIFGVLATYVFGSKKVKSMFDFKGKKGNSTSEKEDSDEEVG